VLLGQPGSFCCLLDPVAYSKCLCLLDLPLHVGFALLDGLVLVDDLAFGRRMVGRLVWSLTGAEAGGRRSQRGLVQCRDCWCRVLYAMSIWFVGVLQVVGERGEIETWDGVVMQGCRIYRVYGTYYCDGYMAFDHDFKTWCCRSRGFAKMRSPVSPVRCLVVT
jgi:hypothetical protein